MVLAAHDIVAQDEGLGRQTQALAVDHVARGSGIQAGRGHRQVRALAPRPHQPGFGAGLEQIVGGERLGAGAGLIGLVDRKEDIFVEVDDVEAKLVDAGDGVDQPLAFGIGVHGLVHIQMDQPVGLDRLEHPLLGLDLPFQLEDAGEGQPPDVAQPVAKRRALQQGPALGAHAIVDHSVIDAVGEQVPEAAFEIGIVVADADDGDGL